MATLSNAWSYVAGQCTWWVSQNASWIPSGLGNAKDWLANAEAKGLPTSGTPSVGSVAVWGGGTYAPFGHVALVTGVNSDGTFKVSEENFSCGAGCPDSRTVTQGEATSALGFILPPGGKQTPMSQVAAGQGVDTGTIKLGSLFGQDIAIGRDPIWRLGLILLGTMILLVGLNVTFRPAANAGSATPGWMTSKKGNLAGAEKGPSSSAAPTEKVTAGEAAGADSVAAAAV